MDKFKTKYVHEKISELFLKSLNKKVFTGSSLAYSYLKRNEFRRTIHHYGKVGFQNRSLAVDNDTFFDLASLTKPLVTTLSLLVLLTEEIIRPEDTLSTLFTFSLPADKKDITLKQLMTHSSGLPPHKPYFQFLLDYHIQQRKDKILQWILQEKLEYKPGKKHLYSDLDFILLGFIIEEKTGQKIDKFWFDKILLPLGLENYFCFEEKKNNNKEKICFYGEMFMV
ncbi:MAG: serine hydrolase [Bacteroidetes bacterium]|nr:serine hydrolase [Bacteroidota bacterium]